MFKFIYAPAFVRQFNKLDKDLQEEVLEKIELFKNIGNHDLLKVHKLHGKFKKNYSFSVNYRFRIVFNLEKENEISFLVIGDHDVYK